MPFTILDGGMGREIERCGGPFRQPEWSALCLMKEPSIVQRVHESFTEGADVITTNTYAVIPFHIGQEKYDEEGKRLLDLAVQLARSAAVNATNNRSRRVRVFGSVPPIGGSYEPESFNEARCAPILQDFLDAYLEVDGLILETIGSIKEAKFYLHQIQQHKISDRKLPIWLSFCLKVEEGDDQHPHLLSGETLSDALLFLDSSSFPIEAVLVNCCDIRLVTPAMKELKQAKNIRIGAYPNAFSIPPPGAANNTLRSINFNITAQVYKAHAKEWIEAGATILGGCCGVGPEHIRLLREIKDEMDTGSRR